MRAQRACLGSCASHQPATTRARRRNHRHTPLRSHGFTIVEMSVVLVVIALIIGAVSVGRDVYRSAMAERIGSEFVQGWMLAYDRYVQQSGTVPGDDIANPSGRVNNAIDTPLCRNDLRQAMLQRGVTLPQGRAEGMETLYVYLDSKGNPQQLEVCFTSLDDWAEPSTGTGYEPRSRNVMLLRGLTPELANQLDTRIDGRVDARFGRMREGRGTDGGGRDRYNETAPIDLDNPEANPWTLNDTHAYGSSGGTGGTGGTPPDPSNPGTGTPGGGSGIPDGTDPDAQVGVMTGYIRMNQ